LPRGAAGRGIRGLSESGATVVAAVAGVRVGHFTGDGTGVTVVLLPPDTVGSCEVRGGAPATRETALLDPTKTVEPIDAIVLAGGSAFGLAAADGVTRALADLGRGFPTVMGPVPIVPAAALYDLVESAGVAPRPQDGRAALDDALAEPAVADVRGPVGAGRGARVGKWRGLEYSMAGGLGMASRQEGDLVVGALAVVNALGDVIAADGSVLRGSTAPPEAPPFPDIAPFEAGGNTTLVVVVTNARASKVDCHLMAQSAHDGFARSLHPVHTRHDGDIAFALATGEVEAGIDHLRLLVTEATAAAVRDSVA
jgi:L-aminopeptidase/D-esterase-like protein